VSDRETPEPQVAAALLVDFAGDIEDQVSELEEAADAILEQVERVNVVAAAVLELARSMKREAERART